jgi:hypothetical protein
LFATVLEILQISQTMEIANFSEMLTNQLNAMVSSLKSEKLNINKLLAMVQHFA